MGRSVMGLGSSQTQSNASDQCAVAMTLVRFSAPVLHSRGSSDKADDGREEQQQGQETLCLDAFLDHPIETTTHNRQRRRRRASGGGAGHTHTPPHLNSNTQPHVYGPIQSLGRILPPSRSHGRAPAAGHGGAAGGRVRNAARRRRQRRRPPAVGPGGAAAVGGQGSPR